MTRDRGGLGGSSHAAVPEKVNLTRAQPIDLPPVGPGDKNQINLRPLIDWRPQAWANVWPCHPPSPLFPHYDYTHREMRGIRDVQGGVCERGEESEGRLRERREMWGTDGGQKRERGDKQIYLKY